MHHACEAGRQAGRQSVRQSASQPGSQPVSKPASSLARQESRIYYQYSSTFKKRATGQCTSSRSLTFKGPAGKLRGNDGVSDRVEPEEDRRRADATVCRIFPTIVVAGGKAEGEVVGAAAARGQLGRRRGEGDEAATTTAAAGAPEHSQALNFAAHPPNEGPEPPPLPPGPCSLLLLRWEEEDGLGVGKALEARRSLRNRSPRRKSKR